uniref:Uncharacterized protein n=1 Tax=Anguilla anguilla TaxID=7936 RepID=A0A0E9T6U9_ANGAN
MGQKGKTHSALKFQGKVKRSTIIQRLPWLRISGGFNATVALYAIKNL